MTQDDAIETARGLAKKVGVFDADALVHEYEDDQVGIVCGEVALSVWDRERRPVLMVSTSGIVKHFEEGSPAWDHIRSR